MTSKLPREQRYRNKVDQRAPDECWPWKAAHNKHGYGTFRGEGNEQLAHRYGWRITFGPIPDGMCVCHRCDNRECQNPGHWFLGTHDDNMADMVTKGRRRRNTDPNWIPRRQRIGPRKTNARLNETEIHEIRLAYSAAVETQEQIAARYGVSQTHVGRIVRGERRALSTGGASVAHTLLKRGERSGKAKLTDDQVREIRRRYEAGGISQAAIAKDYGVTQVTVSRICLGRRYG